MKNFFRDRYSVLSFLVIIMVLIISYKLFSLQIVNGAYYKKVSEEKLFMVNNVKAPRGEIVDMYGAVLANNRPGFTVEITKTKVDDGVLNASLLEIIKILESNGQSYKDNLPIILPYQFVFSSSKEEENWKKKYKIALNLNAKETFSELKQKYNIDPNLSDEIARKIMALRYEMSEKGYNSFKSVILAFDISPVTVSQIEERHLDFPGVNIGVTPIRNYPNGLLASHILGYIGNINQNELEKYNQKGYSYISTDTIGKSGIEGFSEIYLKGTNGKKFVDADLSGRLSSALENQEPTPGGKITLTINKDIQLAAEKALEETINKVKRGGMGKTFSDVKGGTAIAVDVNTGGILALASYPNIDSNAFSKGISMQDWSKISIDPLHPMTNKAISGLYPPGSTFKMITAIGALEEEKVTINEKILDTGEYNYSETYKPACWLWRQSRQTHGYVNVSEALKVSCNVFFYEISNRLGIDKLDYYASLFGLDKKTGIELSGEATGIVAGPESRKRMHNSNKIAFPNSTWYGGDTLQTGIGQSDTVVTPIAMASYISTLANGGTKYQLHLIKSQTTYDEKEVFTESSPIILGKVNIQPQNLKAIFEGMKGVVEEGGTAYGTFKDYPREVAGKTGTSQLGSTTNKSPHAWFTGFAPYNNPEIAVVVLIENGGSGGYTGPVAKAIFSEYFKLPTEEEEVKAPEGTTPNNPSPNTANANNNPVSQDAGNGSNNTTDQSNPAALPPEENTEATTGGTNGT